MDDIKMPEFVHRLHVEFSPDSKVLLLNDGFLPVNEPTDTEMQKLGWMRIPEETDEKS